MKFLAVEVYTGEWIVGIEGEFDETYMIFKTKSQMNLVVRHWIDWINKG